MVKPSLEQKLVALGAIAAGASAAFGLVLAARGRHQDLYPFMIAGALVGTVLTAAQALGDGSEQDRCQGCGQP